MSLLQLFAFLSVVFEPTFRLIAHAASFSVLQSSGPHETRLVRYRILDDDPLTDPILQWIEPSVPTEELADCRRTILLAVRCCVAFAYGAIVTFDDATKGIRALLMKAMYLILTAARGAGGQRASVRRRNGTYNSANHEAPKR